jgi:hypothetical protein
MSARQYAAELGVHPKTFEYWRWRFGKGANRDLAWKRSAKSATPDVRPLPSTALARRPASETVALSFVEMPRETASREPFEVVLVNGLRVRVPTSFDDGALDRLLDVVERRR